MKNKCHTKMQIEILIKLDFCQWNFTVSHQVTPDLM